MVMGDLLELYSYCNANGQLMSFSNHLQIFLVSLQLSADIAYVSKFMFKALCLVFTICLPLTFEMLHGSEMYHPGAFSNMRNHVSKSTCLGLRLRVLDRMTWEASLNSPAAQFSHW